MNVPFLDLRAHHEPIRAEIMAAIAAVVDTSAFAGGPVVAEFETEFAAYCGTRDCVGVANGTDALWLTLVALGVGPGDEVITVPNTFIATAEAISWCGATPVFVDVEPVTCTLDPALLEAVITPRTKAIIPVHLYGQMADLDPILEIAARHQLLVIEDACQAHGAQYRGRKAGSSGDAGCFSFYPGKNLGAWGEAGAVTTNNPDLARQIRILREHGQTSRYYHSGIGWNGRMDGVQAAVLRVKLRGLDRANAARRELAAAYALRLADLPEIAPLSAAPDRIHACHLLVVMTARRDQVLAGLARRGIAAAIHYPCPIHLQKAYAGLGLRRGSFPVAERCSAECLSLPLFPEMTLAQVDAVVEALRAAVAENSAIPVHSA